MSQRQNMKKGEDEKKEAVGAGAGAFSIDWTADLFSDLTCIITESSVIKVFIRALVQILPQKDGGGHPKTDFLFMVAETLWEKEVMKYKAEMGETGAGIQREDDIDMSLDNLLTEAWSRIRDICPWFFDMKAVMA
ncbi:hypothetical protein BDP27DRAFT_1427533 [Rhodocollybia butyracea]|uniref:Uncharacterized protein n=1 Tax=Rhodocollybia butyracea TaxID=206335 RepID=A0A9P5PIM8_9AGAR|nr:hypothetical protein BDP27DRAFT_1427533 [Rhodocollybia butyracea]